MGFATELFNVVVLPVTPFGEGQLFQLSAGRRDGAMRMVSPYWSEEGVRDAFAGIGVRGVEVEELLRGNVRAGGRRGAKRVYFSGEQLVGMGLVEVVEAAEVVAEAAT